MTRGTGLVKRNRGATVKNNVYSTPGRIIDQFPGMAASHRVLGKQDVTWMKNKVVPGTRLEVQCAAQRDDELPDGRGVPIKNPGRGLLKRGGCHRKLSGQEIAARTGFEFEPTLLEIGVLVIAAPKTHTSNHLLSSLLTSGC
jgi:hypothetical protein